MNISEVKLGLKVLYVGDKDQKPCEGIIDSYCDKVNLSLGSNGYIWVTIVCNNGKKMIYESSKLLKLN